MKSASYPFWDGFLTVTCGKDAVLKIELSTAPSDESFPTSLSDTVYAEIKEYFSGKRNAFSFPMCFEGTEFQKRVWTELLRIPYGETVTYGELARRVGSPGAARAVGMACHNNPLIFAVPCHRVVGAGGRLTGYALGLELKKALLSMECAGKPIT